MIIFTFIQDILMLRQNKSKEEELLKVFVQKILHVNKY